MKSTVFYLLGLLPLFVFSQSAEFPSPGTLYDGKLHRIHIWMNEDSLTALLAPENRWTNHTYPADFIYDGNDTLKNIGIRIKGNTSRNAKKLSFRLSFDEFENQTYQGLKTINLNGNHNDPSVSRELLSNYVMNEAGIIATRVNHIQLYINGVYRGVYAQAEHINKKFLTTRFNESSGNLYKCSWPADLTWKGSNQQTYKDIINPSPLNERAYELKTNESVDDYSDLVLLINTINNTPTAQFKNAIDTLFDVDAFLKVLAAEILLGHWDNYAFNKNNYYIYHQQQKHKFYYIPYDMDNTLGVQWGFGDVNNRNVNNWVKSEIPLSSKILAVPEYKSLFHLHIYNLCNSVFNSNKLFPKIDSIKTYLTPAIAVDSFFTGNWESDYGFTVNDWQNSFSAARGGHVSFGIKPFIESRGSSALLQINVNQGVQVSHEKPLCVVFPNPVQHTLYVSGAHAFDLSITDITGRKIWEGTGNEINTSNLNNGVYHLLVQHENKTATYKIVIAHE